MVAVPFYIRSDHDVYGSDIYQVLKSGAKGTVWSSPTLICSPLQWARPTLANLEASVVKYAPTHRARAQQADSRVGEAATAEMEAQWLETTLTTQHNRMAKEAVSEDAEIRYNNIRNSDIFDIRSERKWAAEFETMVKQKTVCYLVSGRTWSHLALTENRSFRLRSLASFVHRGLSSLLLSAWRIWYQGSYQ